MERSEGGGGVIKIAGNEQKGGIRGGIRVAGGALAKRFLRACRARIREISTVQFACGHVFIQHHVVRVEFLSSELEA